MSPRVVRLAAALALATLPTVARGAETPFPEVPMPAPTRTSHAWAYVSLATGAGLLGASYLFARHADDTYDSYLAATDVDEIERLYDRTVTLDRLSSASLIAGEALVATGLYFRFLRTPRTSHVRLALSPRRCAVSLAF